MHRRCSRLRRILAFTLLELSVSIAVVGILLGGALVVITKKTDSSQLEKNVDHLDEIIEALNKYKTLNGKLPCPASRTELDSVATFGKQVNAGDCTYTTAPAGTTRVETAASSGVWVLNGAVPIYDLKLPDSHLQDPYGNRYTYSVIQSLTSASTFEEGVGSIIIKDSAGNDIITDGAYVLVSHGKEGEGAYRGGSGTLVSACGATSLDIENCDNDATFIIAEQNDAVAGASYYSDTVRWRSKQSLIDSAAASSTSCALPWGGSIADGVDVTAYLTASGTCTSETRTCTEGTLSGTYTFETCTPSYGTPPTEYAFRMDGATAGERAGYDSTIAIGDINGDGYGDAIIGAPFASPSSRASAGSAYVVFGSADGINAHPASLSTLNGTNGFRLDGAAAADYAGYSVHAGDINNDGFDDVIVGAVGANISAGYTYVVFGKVSGWAATMELSSVNGTTGFRYDGTINQQTGRDVGSGDINGDGFDDVLIASYNANSNAGYTFVIFGKASGWAATNTLSSLNGTTGFRLDGVSANEWSGYDLSTGDINNDGFDDITIGAPQANSNAGYIYIVFGKANGWGATTSLSTLNGTTGFRLNGSAGDYAGYSVSNGDVNGDGYDDVVVGANFANSNTGYTYVVFGKASGWAANTNLSTLNGTTGFRLDGVSGALGYSVGSGDFNGDGFSDVLAGAPNGGSSNSGYLYVVFGKASGWTATVNISTLNGTTGFRLDGSAAGHWVGGTLAGDITGDGYMDILAYADASYNSLNNSGSVYGVYGRPSTDPLPKVNNNLNTLCCPPPPPTKKASRLDGVAASDYSGSDVAIGDINGDGYGDAIILASNTVSYDYYIGVIFGSAAGINAHPANLSTLNGTTGFKLTGTNGTNMLEGFSVSSGDINGDGFDDVIIGNGLANSWRGYVYVVFGKASGWAASLDLSTLNGTTGFRLDGTTMSDYAGRSVTTGDINNDGYDDIIVGANSTDFGGSESGSAYIVFGKSAAWSATNALSSLDGPTGFRLDGTAAGQWVGYSVASGDINNDTYDDIIIGAPQADPVAWNEGSTFVVFGKAGAWTAATSLSTLNGTTGFRLNGVGNNAQSGFKVSSGDLNGDGYADVLIGAPGTSFNGGDTGSAYVVFGSAGTWTSAVSLSTLNGTIGFRLDGELYSLNHNRSDFAVDGGDFNGDGFDDLSVGVNYSSKSELSNQGSAYLVFGKANGWAATANLSSLMNGTTGVRLDGSAHGAQAGKSITMGDITGDNHADVIVGAFYASNNSLALSGSTYAVYGHPTRWKKPSYKLDQLCCYGTPPTDNAFRLDGSAGDWVGMGQVGIGDVNADGYGDAIIGAYYRNPVAGGQSGAVYVVFGSATGINAHPENLSTLDGTNGFRLDGYNIEYAGAGTAVGDLNGDGIGDILVGSFTGTYVVFGKASGWTATMALSSINGTNGTKLIGSEMYAAVGDINGDGIDDAIMSESSCTRNAYVVFGKSSAWAATLTLSSLNGTDGFKLTGGGGCAVPAYATSGDINGDGYDDIMYGDWGHNSLAGRLYVVFGKSGAWAASTAFATLANGTTGFELEGASANDVTGQGIAAGDINNDGYEDIITGAAGANTGLGYTYVVFGKSGTWSASTNLSTLNGTTGFRLDGTGSGDGASAFGAWVDSGDINGDGFDDVVVGAFSDGFGGTTSGSTYVVFGKSGAWSATNGVNTLVNGTLGFRLDGSTANDASGRTLAVGDMTGDNYDDILIGAYFASYNSLPQSGSVWGVYGKPISWSASYDLNTLAGISGGGGGGDCPAPSGTPITGVTYSGTIDFGWGYQDEAKMRDGFCSDTSTVAGTSYNEPSFITADFGTEIGISKIHLAPISGWYINDLSLECSDGISGWNNITTTSGHSEGTTTTYDVNLSCRYIRVSGNTAIGVGDFWFEEAGGGGGGGGDCPAPSGTPITGVTYSVSSDYGYSGYMAEPTMRDGNCDSSDTATATSNNGGEWIQADLGASYDITKIHLAPIPNSFGGWGAGYLNDKEIQYYYGGVWNTYATTSGHSDGTTTTYDVSFNTQYIRIYVGSSDYIGLGEFWFEAAGASCSLPWGGTINHGDSTTAYEFANSGAGSCSSSETRTCTNGTLSGSFTNQSCSGGGDPPCDAAGGPNNWNLITSTTFDQSSSYGYTGNNHAAMTDNTYNAANSVIGTNSGTGEYIEVDLGATLTVSYIQLAPISTSFQGWGPGYLNGYNLRCFTGASWCSLGTLNHSDDSLVTYDVDAICRAITVQGNGYIGIGDFKVYSAY